MRTRGGFRIATVAGIDVVVDWSLLIIFLLITFSLAAGVFPAWHPDWGAGLAWITALAAAVVFFASILVHELSHALVARAHGVEVRRITLFMFGGMAHMESESPTWRAEFAIAIVGPLTSLALGLAFLWAGRAVAGPLPLDPARPQEALAGLGPVPTLLLWLGPVNILLAIFNLVPGYPLDGGRVLRALLWAATGDLRLATRRASQGGQAFAWFLMGTGLLMIFGLRVPGLGGGFVSGLWLMFIGWFLNNAALMSYRQLVLRDSLEDVPVARVMQTQLTHVDAGTTLRTLVDDLVMPSGQRSFPVEDQGRFAGIVSLRDLQKREQGVWAVTPVREVMTPVQALAVVSPDEGATDALALLGRHDVNQLAVVDRGRLVGLLRREDVLKWLALHTGSERA
jgi:Zn-dependent protease/CBS domain-containing protein